MRKFLSSTAGSLFIINGLTALSYAFILPIMSTFLVEGLKSQPTFITFYSIGFALSGILFSQWMGGLVDKGYSNKKLFIFSLLAILMSGIAFLLCSNAWQALLIGIFLMGPGNASIPLLLSMIRRYSVTAGKNATRLNSQMRSGVSLVWIIGPALAFIVTDMYGFKFNFIASAVLACCVIIYSTIMLSPADVQPAAHNDSTQKKNSIPMTVWLLGGVMVLSNLANNLYITSMPLYITHEEKLPMFFPGLLLGLTALLEIPVMLAASSISEKTGKFRMMLFGFFFAMIYYTALQFTHSMFGFLLLQIFNALFYGIFIGLGITIIQEAIPERSGFSSAFYSNAMRIGMMSGTSLAGILAQLYSFKVALIAPIISILLSITLLTWVSAMLKPTQKNVSLSNEL
ncbi:sugar efflux transporter [Serratia rhizosphaerae]|uniref:sugar efflux transporter n=1 Tax=Serratia sp. Tan611 TaxID=2773264 RepID=UPI0019312A59|nr:sugar efflux transporter [Serratia sp. Tan611]CAE1147824.1 MFS transporter [Serratia sp. Tan611]